MREWLAQFGEPTTNFEKYPSGYFLDSSTESLVVSILSAGTFFGALLGAPVADHVGRKWVRARVYSPYLGYFD